MNAFKMLLVVPALVLGSTACSSAPSEASPDEEVESSEEALTACGQARYAEAFAHYKKAVDASKERLRSRTCEWNDGFLWSIADHASRAVMTCAEFRGVIRTSPWAAPLRQALAPSLTLRSLSGELLVIKDSAWANWSGVDAFFTKGGLSFWARAEGAYGPAVRIDFAANGRATWGELHYDARTGDITWRSIPATYAVSKATSRESGPRNVTVTREGKTTTFTLGVQSGYAYADAPLFTLTPASAGSVPVLFSLVSECDA